MGFFDIFSGGPFDFNGDGHTDPAEIALGLAILDDAHMQEKEQQRQELVDDLLRNAAQYGVEYTDEEIQEFLADSERLGLLD